MIGSPASVARQKSDVEMVHRLRRLSSSGVGADLVGASTMERNRASLNSQGFQVASNSAMAAPSAGPGSLLTCFASSARLGRQASRAERRNGALELSAVWRITPRKRPAPFSVAPQYFISVSIAAGLVPPALPEPPADPGSMTGSKPRTTSSSSAPATRRCAGSFAAAKTRPLTKARLAAIATRTHIVEYPRAVFISQPRSLRTEKIIREKLASRLKTRTTLPAQYGARLALTDLLPH